VTDPKRILPNRKNVCIIHKKNLNEVDGFHYLGREHIAKVYRLSNPEQEAKVTKKAVVQLEETAEVGTDRPHSLVYFDVCLFGFVCRAVGRLSVLRSRPQSHWLSLSLTMSRVQFLAVQVQKEQRVQSELQQQLHALDAEQRDHAETITNLQGLLEKALAAQNQDVEQHHAESHLMSAPEVVLEIPAGGTPPSWEDRKHKQTGQTARVVTGAPHATQELNAALKPGLILYSMQGRLWQELLPEQVQELEQQRPLKLVFRHKFSDLSKKSAEELREQQEQEQEVLSRLDDQQEALDHMMDMLEKVTTVEETHALLGGMETHIRQSFQDCDDSIARLHEKLEASAEHLATHTADVASGMDEKFENILSNQHQHFSDVCSNLDQKMTEKSAAQDERMDNAFRHLADMCDDLGTRTVEQLSALNRKVMETSNAQDRRMNELAGLAQRAELEAPPAEDLPLPVDDLAPADPPPQEETPKEKKAREKRE
jgi:hypothetical protein